MRLLPAYRPPPDGIGRAFWAWAGTEFYVGIVLMVLFVGGIYLASRLTAWALCPVTP